MLKLAMRQDANAWKILILLTLTNVMMSLDRTIPQLVAEPVRLEFGLTDAQLGSFIGVAFGLSYGLTGLMIGPLIDRFNRQQLLAAILAIWSGMTFLTGLVGSYFALLAARAGVGAAESGGNPAALSLIGDLFPAERRSSAIGIYKIGVPAGILLASALVGLFAMEHGWRTVFFVAGLPGLILAMFVWFGVGEPRRGRFDGNADTEYKPVPYFDALRLILSDRSILPLTISLFMTVFAGAAIQAFTASFLQRSHGMQLDEVGLYLGIGSAISAISPVVIGLFADKVVRKGTSRLIYFLAMLNGLAAIAALFMLTQQGAWLVLAAMLAWQFLSMGITTPGMAAIIALSPLGMRGTSVAVISVGNILIGFGFGPLVVGLVSDAIGSTDSLRISMIVVSASAYIMSSVFFALSGWLTRNDGTKKRIL